MAEDYEAPPTPEEMDELEGLIGGYPKQQEKFGLFIFLNKVLEAWKRKQILKTANLDMFELEAVRNLQDGFIISDIFGYKVFENYFNNKSKVTLASSDSKEGFLIKAAITSKKEMATSTKVRKENKGWFKKKDEASEVM